MNKYEEALDDVINKLNGNYIPEVKQQLGVLQELVKRATPMKPKFTGWDYKCPTCNKLVTNGSKWQCEHFCDECGQALDWSEEK